MVVVEGDGVRRGGDMVREEMYAQGCRIGDGWLGLGRTLGEPWVGGRRFKAWRFAEKL